MKHPSKITMGEKGKLQYIKDQAVPFYFALIEVSLIITFIGLFFDESRNKLISNLMGLIFPLENFAAYVAAYLLALSLLGVACELFLGYTNIIDLDSRY
jgi:hypothetical protein